MLETPHQDQRGDVASTGPTGPGQRGPMGAEHWVPVSKPTLLAYSCSGFLCQHGPGLGQWSEHVAILSPAGGSAEGNITALVD